MEQLFWACLIGGVLFAVVTVIFGDLISNALDGLFDFLSIEGNGVFQPMVLVGAITSFGGIGLLLLRYSPLASAMVIVAAVLGAIGISVIVYFAYVKPMENSENSTAFSIRDLSGRIGEVLVPIPSRGYGEVLVKIGAGNTNQIAASFDGDTIESGVRVVVVEVRDDTLFVTRLETDPNSLT